MELEIAETIFSSNEIEGICQKRKIYKNGILNCAGVREQKNGNYDMVQIRALFDYVPGSIASESNNDDGEYNFVTASSDWKKHDEFSHDCEALVIAVAASGSLGRTHYIKGKFTASNLCLVLTPKSKPKYKLDLRFYKYYFDSIREQLRADLADGTSKLTIDSEDLMDYYIEYIPYKRQLDFYTKNIEPFEKLKAQAISAEINLQNRILDLLQK